MDAGRRPSMANSIESGRIVFISANEKLDGGLLQTQLVVPVEKYFGARAEIVNIHRWGRNSYRSKALRVVNLPILAPFRFVNFRPWFLINEILCVAYALPIAFHYASQNRDITFVARGYVPGLVCWWLNLLLGSRYIFDPRSLYVHEHVGAGILAEGSPAYRYWMQVEQRVARRAAAVVSVSEAMAAYFRALNGAPLKSRTVLIPCFAAERTGTVDPSQNRDAGRAALGYETSDIIVVYYGSLNAGWNNVDRYTRFFAAAGSNGVKVLILSQDAEALRTSALGQLAHVKITSTKELSGSVTPEMCLDAADYGIVLMNKAPDWKTRLSVKFAEYTSAGLPVIVGTYVGEAARLVRTFGLSPSLILGDDDPFPGLRRPLPEERRMIRVWAMQYFSPSNILRMTDF